MPNKQTEVNAKKFIKIFLLKQIGEIVAKRYAYLSFSLITLGIEFLGACLDWFSWDERRLSGKRFRKAITVLFPSSYHQCNNGGKYDLYNNLRSGFAHQFRPGKAINLTELKEKKTNPHVRHLGMDEDGRLILIAETFYEDFATACHTIIKRNSAKIRRHYLSIKPVEAKKKTS